MNGQIEHANVNVSSIETAIKFFQTAFPHFRIRGSGGDAWRWVHIGTDDTYICLNGNPEQNPELRSGHRGYGFNHIGFIVDDADALRERMLQAGYQEAYKVAPHPFRKRVYFHDPDGNEYEFVEYLSDNPAERNRYD